LSFDGERIKKEKDMVKEKNTVTGKGKKAGNPLSLSEVRGLWVWVGVFQLNNDYRSNSCLFTKMEV
jgi:hypothetical protein